VPPPASKTITSLPHSLQRYLSPVFSTTIALALLFTPLTGGVIQRLSAAGLAVVSAALLSFDYFDKAVAYYQVYFAVKGHGNKKVAHEGFVRHFHQPFLSG
jgi:uncharacterized protein involved in cysteine biosynthesis